MIIIRRVKHRNQRASFNALLLAPTIGSVGYATWYALNAGNKEFRHKQRDYMKRNPVVQAGLITAFDPAVAAGYYGGKIFNRTRRTKNGKVIVEQVRRK